MNKRRTKKEIQQARYFAEVDKYKYFVLYQGRIITGFEFKNDCNDTVNDYDGAAKIVTKLTAKNLGIDTEAVKARFKAALI